MNGTRFTSANESADLTKQSGYTGHKCARGKRGASEKAPQIAHYKMIIAHIHVLLCFRK